MKQNITQQEFDEKLKTHKEFDDEIFNFGNNNIVFPRDLPNDVRFINCSFTGDTLKVEDINLPEIGICFVDCAFKCKVEIFNSTIDRLWFMETTQIEEFLMHKFKDEDHFVNSFEFSYSNKKSTEIHNNFKFKNYNFKDSFIFENVNMHSGEFLLENNTFGNTEHNNPATEVTFKNSKLHNILFKKNIFNIPTRFFKTNFSYNPDTLHKRRFTYNCFTENTFEYVDFSNSIFEESFGLWECNFNGITSFHNIKNDSDTNLRIFQCQFNQYTSFDNAKIFRLFLYRSIFNGITSFQSAKFTQIEIDKTLFEKGSFFDDIKITALKVCKRKTLRLIKQELQKADNKIDYNRFRGYELAAYYRELKWYGNFRDKFILASTWLVTGFDHSWIKAFFFTVLSGLSWYSALYFFEFYIALNLNNNFNFSVGAFRFFLVTDFYSPFLDREYINNGYSWTFFVLGKIFIAFGIYEMIQAFRKFKS